MIKSSEIFVEEIREANFVRNIEGFRKENEDRSLYMKSINKGVICKKVGLFCDDLPDFALESRPHLVQKPEFQKKQMRGIINLTQGIY